MPTAPLIELRQISKRFGAQVALDDVSLELRPGERLALVGENGAGKSSLMNVLYGLYQPDGGTVRFDGQVVKLRTPADALERGVGMVHQHFTLVPALTVAENVVLGHEPTRKGLLDLRQAMHDVAATCERLRFSLDPAARVSQLSVGSQQKVEIVKALHRGVKTLILDEPTAVLTPQEADELFAVTRTLSEQGLTIVLISHKLKEVLSFASRVVVMRRGAKVAEAAPEQTTAEALAGLVVGESTALTSTATAVPPRETGDIRVSLANLEAEGLHGVSLEVRSGEIVGIAGVDGNGQRELAEVLTGLRPWSKGTFSLHGKPLASLSTHDAHALKVAHVPEDRLRHALVADLSVEENASLGRHAQAPFARSGFIDFAQRRAKTRVILEENDVRPRSPEVRAGNLSGGNQQKLVVGREIDSGPEVLVAVQPTRGLDIAAVRAVRAKLIAQRDAGCAVVLVSLDLDEVLSVADRVLVMYAGRVTAELSRAQFDERLIGRHMLGLKDEGGSVHA